MKAGYVLQLADVLRFQLFKGVLEIDRTNGMETAMADRINGAVRVNAMGESMGPRLHRMPTSLGMTALSLTVSAANAMPRRR